MQPEQVGAYLFRYSQELSGCETVPLEIDPDTGIDEDEFAAVFEAIYDESIALQRDRRLMAYSQLAESIRDTYGNCCLTDSFTEPNCRIDVSGLEDSRLATIHGDFNQRCPNHAVATRLCDRFIFGRLNERLHLRCRTQGWQEP